MFCARDIGLERFPHGLEPSPSEARFSWIPSSRQIFPNKIDAAHADVFFQECGPDMSGHF